MCKFVDENYFQLPNFGHRFSVIMTLIDNKTVAKEINDFLKKGGRINKYYLKNPRRNPVLVFYKRWYRGRNIREAIKRALSA